MVRDCSTCGGSSKVIDSHVCNTLSQAGADTCRSEHFALWFPGGVEQIPGVINLPGEVDPSYPTDGGPEAIDETEAVAAPSFNIFMGDLQETAHDPFMTRCQGYILSTIFEDGIRLEVNTDIITGGFFISEDAIDAITAGISSLLRGGAIDPAEIFSKVAPGVQLFETKTRTEPQAETQEDLYGPRVEPEMESEDLYEPTGRIQGCPGGPLRVESEDEMTITCTPRPEPISSC